VKVRGALIVRVSGMAVAASLVLSMAGMAGASTNHHKSKQHKPKAKVITISAAGKQYLAIVTPVNATLNAFVTRAKSWSSSTTNSEALSDAQPAITALQSAESELLADQWPSGDTADVKTLVSDIGPLSGDLQGLGTINLLNASSWASTFQRDASTLSSAVAIVRHDLGLPPASGSG